MWYVRVFGVAAVAVAAGAAGRWAPATAQKDGPKRAAEVCLPPVADGKVCLFRVGKVLTEGRIDLKLGDDYKCNTVPPATASGDVVKLVARLKTAGPPCDEDPKLIPDGSLLRLAQGDTSAVRRADDFTHLTCPFEIVAVQTRLFAGHLEATHRISTHHKPFAKAGCEDPCDRRQFLQGWLVGAGTDTATKGFTLRAFLTATTDPIGGGTKGYALGDAAIDGVLLRNP